MCKLECRQIHVFTDSVLCFLGKAAMNDALNLFAKRWNDHIVSKGVTGTDSQDSVNLANPMLAATPSPSRFTFHLFLCATTTEIKEEIEKMAGNAASERKHPECYGVGNDERNFLAWIKSTQ